MSNYDDASDDPDKGERKRQREKQRRCDLANAFDELQATLNRVGRGLDIYGRPIKADLNSETPVTRLGLVLQTTEALQRLHQENMHMRLTLGGVDDGSVRTTTCVMMLVRQNTMRYTAHYLSLSCSDRGDRSLAAATTITHISRPPTTNHMVTMKLTIRQQLKMARMGTTLQKHGTTEGDMLTIMSPPGHPVRHIHPMVSTERLASHPVVYEK